MEKFLVPSPWARLSELAYLPDRTFIMRIHFNSLVIPKKAAKRIKKHFSPLSRPDDPLALNEAQKITAWMLGYDTWHELEQVTKSARNPSSLLDEYATKVEQGRRIDFQSDVLNRILPLSEPLIRELALQFRVSSSNPLSIEFSDDYYRRNVIFYWEPLAGEAEWRFRPSLRSKAESDYLYDLMESWNCGRIKIGEYLEQLQAIMDKQPENLLPYIYAIDALREIGEWSYTENYLPLLESAIEGAIPDSYPREKKVPAFNWGTMENRDFLRGIYHLALGFYAVGNFGKSKLWFLFLTRCSPFQIGAEKYFLEDLRRVDPDGNFHLLDDKDMRDSIESDQ